MIPAAEFRHEADDLAIGEQKNVDHVFCLAGADTRKRLYIRRTESAILAYCHNCGQAGFVALVPKTKCIDDLLKSGESTKGEKEDLYLPEDVTPDICTWPHKALSWLDKYFLWAGDASIKYGFVWSPSYGRLIMPVYEGTSLVYWQGRGFNEYQPKYLSSKAHDKVVYSLSYPGRPTAVIVEDIISAIRCYEAGADAYALLGTSIEVDSLRRKLDKYHRVVIMLDPDLPGQRASIDITRRLSLVLTADVITLMPDKQPKEYDKARLRSVIGL